MDGNRSGGNGPNNASTTLSLAELRQVADVTKSRKIKPPIDVPCAFERAIVLVQ